MLGLERSHKERVGLLIGSSSGSGSPINSSVRPAGIRRYQQSTGPNPSTVVVDGEWKRDQKEDERGKKGGGCHFWGKLETPKRRISGTDIRCSNYD